MRIGFVAHNFVFGNGQGRINFEIVRRALELGHIVTLLADQVSPELIGLGAKWIRIRSLPRRPNLLGAYTAAFNADHVLPKYREQFDVIVGAGFTLRSPHDVNLCQFVHGAWLKSPAHVSRLRGGLYGLYQRCYSASNARWERHAYAASRCVIAPSEKIRAELISIGVPADRISIIYNGVDLNEFFPAWGHAEKTSERAALGLPADVPLALFVGDIRTPRKNLDSVLKALIDVPQVHLAVAGDLAMSPFPALARQLGINDRVHFVGYTLEVKRYMRAADLFVFPSRYEAGTLVLMEAAASGLPIVTAKTAGGAEVFGADAATVIDDPEDLGGLASAIARFGNSAEQRERSGKAALAVVQRHTWRSMADEYLHCFDAHRHDRKRIQVRPATSSFISS